MAKPGSNEAGIPYRKLGRTGERVSAIGLGGWHLALPNVGEQLALRIVRTAIDEGINFLDNSWDYNGGASERRMGKALRGGYREKVFLMTKIDGRSKREASRQLDESLRRLKTDRIDLVQHHEVLRFDDSHRIFEEDGANAALLAARKAGKLRYIGFTGHKDPRIHLHTLEVAREHGFTFDAVQMPLNVMDAHYRSFERMVLPELVRRRIGVLGEEPGERADPPVEDGQRDRVPALRAESADVGGHHRVRQHEDPGAGAGGGAHLPSTGQAGGPEIAGEDSPACVDGGARAVQDHLDLRRDGRAPRVDGRGAEAVPADDAGLRRPVQRLSCGVQAHCYGPVSAMDWMRRYGWRLAAAVSLVLAVVSALEPRGFRRHARLRAQAEALSQRNVQLREENLRLTREIEGLRNDPAAIERAAREELGFVKPGEIVIHLE